MSAPRIRAAEQALGALPVYDDRGVRVGVIGRDARIRDLSGRLLPGRPDWPLRYACEIVAARPEADRA